MRKEKESHLGLVNIYRSRVMEDTGNENKKK